MESGDGRSTPGPQPEASKFNYEGTKTKFEPSFLAEKPEDILRIKDRTLRRRVHLMHNDFVNDPNTLSPDELKAEAKELREGISSGKYKSQDAEFVRQRLNAQARKEEAAQKPEAKQEAQSKKTEEEKPKQETSKKAEGPFPKTDEIIKDAAIGLGSAVAGAKLEDVVEEGVKAGRRFVGRMMRRGERSGSQTTGSSTASESKSEPKSASGPETTPTGNAGEPPKKPPTPPTTPEANENELPQKNFGEIQNRIISLAEKLYRTDPKDLKHTKDDDELAALVAKREEIYERAEKRGLIGEIREAVINTIKESNWNNVRGDILSRREGIVKTFNDNAGDDPEFEGLADAAVKTIADSVAIQGYFRAKRPDGTWDEAFLGRHGQTIDTLNAREFRSRASAFVVFTDDLADLVGYNQRKTQEGRKSYEQAGGLSEDEGPDIRSASDVVSGRGPTKQDYEMAAPPPPDHIVATFLQGKYRRYKDAWSEVEWMDITNKADLEKWAFLNMRVFNDGTIPGVEKGWKNILDVWLGDLKDSTRRADKANGGLTLEQKKDIDEARQKLIDMMATSSAARAMDQSDGGAADYVATVTQSTPDHPDTAKQDTWKEFLLAKDSSKYDRLIHMPLVRAFYKQVLEDAGVVVDIECGKADETLEEKKKNKIKDSDTWNDFDGWIVSRTNISKIHLQERAANKEMGLVRFLTGKAVLERDEKGKPIRKAENGFEDYIKYLLAQPDFMDKVRRDAVKDIKNEKGEPVEPKEDKDAEYSAARLACDAFQVEKFTSWEMALTNGYNPNSQSSLGELKPFKGWGGDPFRMTEEPAFLPRRIKNKYQGRDSAVLVMFDNAFRPLDIFQGKLEKERVRGNAIAHLKNLYRLNTFIWTGLGGSTAPNIPNFNPKSIAEEIPAGADLIDQVYGGIGDYVKDKNGKYVGLRVDSQGALILNSENNPVEVVIDDTKRYTKDDQEVKDDPEIEGTIKLPENVRAKKVPIGKEIGGAMMSRLLEAKALALTLESQRPGWREYIKVMFQGPEAQPFFEVEKLIFGTNLNYNDGLITSLAGGRTRFIFNKNVFGADTNLVNIWKLLTTNDQDPRGRGKMETANRVGFVLDVIQAISSGGKPRR